MSRLRRALLVVSAALLLTSAAVSPAAADRQDRQREYTFAVIGDLPYGAPAAEAFPEVVDRINADPDVKLVAHLGDIKSGSTRCSDEYFASIRAQFDRFADPLVYTPGDNEWTDCHRPTNGAYNPLERLDAIRDTFFDRPGRTLGEKSVRIQSQQRYGYPENVQWSQAGVTFASVHIVGSNNGMAPWTGNTAATPEQTAEVLGRTAASIEAIHDAFAAARSQRSRAVMIMTQADMFDPTFTPTFAGSYAFKPIIQTLVDEARRFRGPVYLVNGDSHIYNEDRPLAAESTWPEFYGIADTAENLTRITVDGADNADNYLKFVVQRRGAEVLTWQQVPYNS
jgi:hypothetical protein